MEPNESKKHNNICPKCKKELTIGVLNRVEELADREEGFKPKNAKPFYSLIPLSEIISTVNKNGIATQKTWKEYYNIMKDTTELHVLQEMSKEELLKRTSQAITNAILKSRSGTLKFIPGYDGEYGIPLFDKEPPKKEEFKKTQMNLGDY